MSPVFIFPFDQKTQVNQKLQNYKHPLCSMFNIKCPSQTLVLLQSFALEPIPIPQHPGSTPLRLGIAWVSHGTYPQHQPTNQVDGGNIEFKTADRHSQNRAGATSLRNTFHPYPRT